MNVRYTLALAAAVLVGGCGASTPELDKADQAKMDKLFREGIKPANNGSPTPVPGGSEGKPMNQDAG